LARKDSISELLHKTIMDFAYRVADEIEATAILLYADAIQDGTALSTIGYGIDKHPTRQLILVTRGEEDIPELKQGAEVILKIPNLKLTRVGQIKVAITKAIATGILKKGDKVVCLTGIPKFGYIDCIMIIDVGKEFEILTSDNISDIFEGIHPEVFETVLTMALEIGSQGREGRSVGTIFILGDHEKVLQFSRQMIINPFAGYPEEERNILNPALSETIREFSALDGAFIIRENGVLISAGTYLNVATEGKDFPKGLGSRHLAAAGITLVTNAVAIVVSESTGTVRVFKRGKIFVSIEKPVD
jgi:diadenylate cyclase